MIRHIKTHGHLNTGTHKQGLFDFSVIQIQNIFLYFIGLQFSSKVRCKLLIKVNIPPARLYKSKVRLGSYSQCTCSFMRLLTVGGTPLEAMHM